MTTDKQDEFVLGNDILAKRDIVLNCQTVTIQQAITACGKIMLQRGYIEAGYIEAMQKRDNNTSVAVGNHIAIPHGDSDSRTFVKKTGLVVMTYPDGIDWHGELVRLVIGIASKGDEHLEILKRVAAIAADIKIVDRLVDEYALNTIYDCLNGLADSDLH